jgi:ribosomal protein S18 acetylase RimI-like enzyme
MNNILIRKMKESDLPTIGKLMAELIEAIDDTEGIDINLALENCRNLLNDADSYLLVAEDGDTVIGFINFMTHRTVLHSGLSGQIDELVVTKGYRDMGIGQQLVYAAIEECKQLGCCEIEVSTEKVNIKARDFYKKCGFEERGVILEVDL